MSRPSNNLSGRIALRTIQRLRAEMKPRLRYHRIRMRLLAKNRREGILEGVVCIGRGLNGLKVSSPQWQFPAQTVCRVTGWFRSDLHPSWGRLLECDADRNDGYVNLDGGHSAIRKTDDA